MREKLLFFLHNLVMTFFVLLIVFNRSLQNQFLISAVAITYWVVGILLIYKKLSIASVSGKLKTFLAGILSLQKIPVILGCLLFICSIFFPFYHLSQYDHGIKQTYPIWSFKSFYPEVYIHEMWRIYSWEDHLFCDYWFNELFMTDFRLSWVFIFMFVTQILTLAAGMAAIFINRRILAFMSATLCSMVTVLMTYASIAFSELNPTLDSYQQGYWLTYPSILLFLASFTLTTYYNNTKHLAESP